MLTDLKETSKEIERKDQLYRSGDGMFFCTQLHFAFTEPPKFESRQSHTLSEADGLRLN